MGPAYHKPSRCHCPKSAKPTLNCQCNQLQKLHATTVTSYRKNPCALYEQLFQTAFHALLVSPPSSHPWAATFTSFGYGFLTSSWPLITLQRMSGEMVTYTVGSPYTAGTWVWFIACWCGGGHSRPTHAQETPTRCHHMLSSGWGHDTLCTPLIKVQVGKSHGTVTDWVFWKQATLAWPGTVLYSYSKNFPRKFLVIARNLVIGMAVTTLSQS